MAHFKTGYQQREIIVDAAVVGNDIVVGSLITLTPATDELPASIALAVSLASATHIVAQSDTTQEYGHIAVENRDYKPSYSVAATYTGNLAATSVVKKVSLFTLIDKTDIILESTELAVDPAE